MSTVEHMYKLADLLMEGYLKELKGKLYLAAKEDDWMAEQDVCYAITIIEQMRAEFHALASDVMTEDTVDSETKTEGSSGVSGKTTEKTEEQMSFMW